MPSDEMVEKVARALCRLHIQNVARYDNPPPSEDRIQAGVDNCWQHHEEAARAALAAAEAETQPAAWQLRVVDRDPPGEWVDVPRERYDRLGKEPGMEARALYASPSEAAIRADEREKAIRDAAVIADMHDARGDTGKAILKLLNATAIRARGER